MCNSSSSKYRISFIREYNKCAYTLIDKEHTGKVASLETLYLHSPDTAWTYFDETTRTRILLRLRKRNYISYKLKPSLADMKGSESPYNLWTVIAFDAKQQLMKGFYRISSYLIDSNVIFFSNLSQIVYLAVTKHKQENKQTNCVCSS